MADFSLALLFAARERIVAAISEAKDQVPDDDPVSYEPGVYPPYELSANVLIDAVAAALKVIDAAIIATVAATPDELADQLHLLADFYSDPEEPLVDPADAPALIATIAKGVAALTRRAVSP
jgi:hypothetical protein